MTFEQYMIDMTPELVRQAIVVRLRDGAGIFAPPSRDEPVWAMLQSAFRHWRSDAAKTKEVDAALNELLLEAFEQSHWSVALATCEFAVALATGVPPWVPPSSDQWPLPHWLHTPTTPLDKIGASIAALRLFLVFSKAPPTQWVTEKFKTACAPENAVSVEGRDWFEACWSACLQVQGGQTSATVWRLPLFQALAFARRCEVTARERLLSGLIARAWLGTDPALRVTLNNAIVKAARDFDDEAFMQQVLRLTKQEFGNAYRATGVSQAQGAPGVTGAEGLAWLREARSRADNERPENACRRSELWPA